MNDRMNNTNQGRLKNNEKHLMKRNRRLFGNVVGTLHKKETSYEALPKKNTKG